MNTQRVELENIRRKIKALTQKTIANGCSEHEALSAMALVGQLLSQYNLSMDEVDVREQKCRTIYIPLPDRQRRHPIDSCISQLAALFDGKCWFSKKWKRDEKGDLVVVNGRYVKEVSYAFFIQEQDADTVKYLFEVIFKALETEARSFRGTSSYLDAREYGTSRKLAYVSFQKGMAHRISERLLEIKRQNDAALLKRPTGNSLVVLKGQLIDQEWKLLDVKLVKYSLKSFVNPQAYRNGKAAGDRVNLNRPVGDKKEVSGYLT